MEADTCDRYIQVPKNRNQPLFKWKKKNCSQQQTVIALFFTFSFSNRRHIFESGWHKQDNSITYLNFPPWFYNHSPILSTSHNQRPRRIKNHISNKEWKKHKQWHLVGGFLFPKFLTWQLVGLYWASQNETVYKQRKCEEKERLVGCKKKAWITV